jgi:hypothetical protein
MMNGLYVVMPGLVPGIHVFAVQQSKTWMAGSSPAMTEKILSRQFFSRYPVLKIHHTRTMQMTRKPTVMPRLRPTLTSAIS